MIPPFTRQSISLAGKLAGAPGPSQQLVGEFTSFGLVSATYPNDVSISFDGQSFSLFPASKSVSWEKPLPIWLRNENASANDIVAGVGDSDQQGTTAGTVTVLGNVAVTVADGADVAMGAKADAVATTDTGTFSLLALFKRLLAKFPVNAKGNRVRGVTGSMTATTATQVIAAPAAGNHLVVKTIQAWNTHATVATEISITDGNGGTEVARVYCKAGADTGTNGHVTVEIPDGIQLTSATALYAVNITTGSATRVAAYGVVEAD